MSGKTRRAHTPPQATAGPETDTSACLPPPKSARWEPVATPQSTAQAGPSATPVLDQLAASEPAPRDAHSFATDWAQDSHTARRITRPASSSATWESPGWERELEPSTTSSSTESRFSGSGWRGTAWLTRADRLPRSEDDTVPETSLGARAAVDSGGVRVGGELRRNRGDDSSSMSAELGADGLRAGWRDQREVGDHVVTGSSSLRLGEQGLKAQSGMGWKGPKQSLSPLGNPETSDPSRGDFHGPLAGSQGRASAKMTATATGDVRTTRPRQLPDGRWAVGYSAKGGLGSASSLSLSHEGLSMSDQDTSTGGIPGGTGSGAKTSLGVSSTTGLDATIQGERVFDTRDQARGFYLMPDLTELRAPSLSAKGAQDLRPGERTRVEVGVEKGLGVSAQGTGAPSASLGAQVRGSAGVEVRRIDERWFAVTRDLTGDAAAVAGVGAPGLDVAGQASIGGRTAATWRLDLDTDGGRAAYETLLTGGTPEVGPGVQPPLQATAATDGTHAQVGLPAYSFLVGSTSTDLDLQHPDGTSEVRDEGRETQDVSTWRWLGDWLPDFDADTGVGARTRFDVEGQETDSEVMALARTNANSARHNRQAMGRATGTDELSVPGASTSGEWSLSTHFGPGSLDALAYAAQNDPFPADQRPAWQRRFLEDMRAAGTDRQAQRQAVQDLGEHGADAVVFLKGLLRQPGQTFVQHQDSETWIGEEGYTEVDKLVDEVNRLTEDDELDVLRARADKLQRAHVTHKARLHDLTDYGKYPDVPAALREEEVKRTRYIVNKTAWALGKLGMSPGDNEAPEQQALLEEIEQVRKGMDRAYYQVRQAESEHQVGVSGPGSPWWHLAVYEVFGLQLDGDEAERYAEARELKEEGEEARRSGGSDERLAYVQLEQGGDDKAAELRRQTLISFKEALSQFQRAQMVYEAIETDHPESFR